MISYDLVYNTVGSFPELIRIPYQDLQDAVESFKVSSKIP